MAISYAEPMGRPAARRIGGLPGLLRLWRERFERFLAARLEA